MLIVYKGNCERGIFMDNMFELMTSVHQKVELGKILECNQKSEQYGLVLSQDEAKNLMLNRKNSLSETQRVEFGEGIIAKIVDSFCDSKFINQDNYAETLSELQDIFYAYKNETMDELSDNELLDFMRTQYEEICFGDLEYLRNTCLERYGRAVRSGYKSRMQSRLNDEYTLRDTDNEYSKLSEETRWDYEVYKISLEDMY